MLEHGRRRKRLTLTAGGQYFFLLYYSKDIAGGGCFMEVVLRSNSVRNQQLILAKCISGVRIDSKDYGVGYGQASTDFYNPVKGTNNERTTCAAGSRDDYYRASINNTNACYNCLQLIGQVG
jgi:hypothetical protein